MAIRRNRSTPVSAAGAARARTPVVSIAWLAMAALVAPAAPVHAAELIPSVGLTRSVDSNDTQSQVGLALRGGLLPGVLDTELGVGYRKDRYSNGALEVTQVPVTASLLLTPIPSLHGDAGVGWYNTKLDYRDPALPDETKQKFGVHLGGGFDIPLAPAVALDVTGRYVMLQKQDSRLVPRTFNPDFWTLSLGLGFRL
jgi:hypothetical protein